MYSEKSETSGIFQMVSDIYKTFDVFQYEKKIKEVSNELGNKQYIYIYIYIYLIH